MRKEMLLLTKRLLFFFIKLEIKLKLILYKLS